VSFCEVVLQHLCQRFGTLLPSVEILECCAQRLDTVILQMRAKQSAIQRQNGIKQSCLRRFRLYSTSAITRLRSAFGHQTTFSTVPTIPAGRDGLLELITNLPATLKYEPGVIVADGDYVIIHGRFSGIGLPANWIVADVVRLKDGILVEHWDVIQGESTKEQSKSGNPMFGDAFPK
jgi:predicted SnoaL-like aldol condensation-catalyzing enzyme